MRAEIAVARAPDRLESVVAARTGVSGCCGVPDG
jgi:hypothetical protein